MLEALKVFSSSFRGVGFQKLTVIRLTLGSENLGSIKDPLRSLPDILGLPQGSTCTTIMAIGPKRPSILWVWGPNPKGPST